ncbi:hypothetical protein L218DRAFT_966404 [Marasmius fiardii PR-910]|nr:hypothetical protein L218DRAFT_966404 [Marasmius fiardii PR-910]
MAQFQELHLADDPYAAHMSTSLSDNDENLVGDAWTDFKTYCTIIGSDRFGVITPDKAPENIRGMMARDAPHTAAIRKRVAEIVKDKEAHPLVPNLVQTSDF